MNKLLINYIRRYLNESPVPYAGRYISANIQHKLSPNIKKDMTDLRNAQWNLESKVDTKLQSVDTKLTNYDTKLDRFEIKVEKTKTDMEKRIQKSLNNPLANWGIKSWV